MVLEATVLVIDNSEWMRNGDYTPTRIEAQHDAAMLLFNAKTQTNPENTVGLLTLAGKSPSVLVTLTKDIGKILTALHNVQLSGCANLNTGIQIAQLILKHRENKNQKQRIIMQKAKKNNVAIDIVNFGEESDNIAKLDAFIGAVNNNDSSHLVTIPPGPHLLSDVLLTSPIIAGEDGPPPGFSGGAGFEFGVDPSLDPELALALRISMEEERARQEKTTGAPAAASEPGPVTTKTDAPSRSGDTLEDDMLAQALAMSVQDGGSFPDEDIEMADEDEAMARAIAMSMGDDGGAMDSNFMSSMLQSLPGVNPNDPRIQSALQGNKKDEDKEKKEDSAK
ncbi:hypothetical protein BASA83_000446 [Batrachochytrium salamandrivorans]|nr:hypothetical protein BASA83_000446 [Batrachochytrium salamandrivorans]